MKITKSQLRKIIAEELNEGWEQALAASEVTTVGPKVLEGQGPRSTQEAAQIAREHALKE